MTGTELDRIVLELCKKYGIIGVHHPDSRLAAATGKGCPDWILIGQRILYREIKGSNDVLTPEQRLVGRAIMRADGDWMVWGPRDFYPHGAARRELQEIALQ